MWQDYVMAAAAISFSYALVPQVYYGFKNKVKTIRKQTGIITTLGLSAIAYAQYSLDLDFSTITTTAATTLWGTLTVQSFRYKDIKGGLEQKINSSQILK